MTQCHMFYFQLQGDSKEYANVRQMNTSLLCAQYNGLLRRGIILSERKVIIVIHKYDLCIDPNLFTYSFDCGLVSVADCVYSNNNHKVPINREPLIVPV